MKVNYGEAIKPYDFSRKAEKSKGSYKDYYYKYKALKYYLKNNSIEIKGGSIFQKRAQTQVNKNPFLQFLQENKDALEKQLQKDKDHLKKLKGVIKKDKILKILKKDKEELTFPTKQHISVKEMEIENLKNDINKLKEDIKTLKDIKFNDLEYNKDAIEVYKIITTKDFLNFLNYINSTEQLNNLLITYQIQPILNNGEYYPFHISLGNRAKIIYIISNLFEIKLENIDPIRINLKDLVKEAKESEEAKKSNNNLKMDDLTSINQKMDDLSIKDLAEEAKKSNNNLKMDDLTSIKEKEVV